MVRPEDFGFGFDDPDEGWLKELRESDRPPSLGHIGPYRILNEVNRGGQGIVFKAIQPGTGRTMALKRLVAGSFASASMRRRFQTEIEATSSLRHPNVVAVYGMDMVDGQPVLAMEWVEGHPIDEWAQVDGQPRDPGEVLETFLQVCDAVQHAHSRGLIHRDLKPSNILVDADGEPRLLDFGLAKVLAESEVQRRSHTEEGVFLGTTAYASPEQRAQSSEGLDYRTDVYSLGVVLHELLTGEKGSEGDSPGRPSRKDPRLGRDLDTVIFKAIQESKSDRYQTVSAFAQDIRRYISGEPIDAIPPNQWDQLKRMASRFRRLLLVTSVLVLTISSLAVMAWLQAREAERQRDEAEDARTHAQQERDKSVAMRDFLLRGLLLEADPRRGSREAKIVDVLDTLAVEIEGRFEQQLATKASTHALLAHLFEGLGRLKEAERQYSLALDAWALEPPSEVEEIDLARMGLASVLAARGEVAKGESLYRDGLASMREEGRESSLLFADSLGALAALHFDQGYPDEGLRLLHQSKESLDIHGHTQSDAYVKVLLTEAEWSMSQGRWEDARSALDIGRAVSMDLFGEDSVLYGDCLMKQSWLEVSTAQFEEAIVLLRACEAMRSRLSGPDHVDTLEARKLLAHALIETGEIGEARSLLEGIVASLRENDRAGSRMLDSALFQLASAHAFDGHIDRAMELCEESLASMRVREEEGPDIIPVLSFLARLMMRSDRPDDAEPLLQEALELAEECYGPRSPRIVHRLSILARNAVARGELSEAVDCMRDAMDVYEDVGGDLTHFVAGVGAGLEAFLALGQVDDAEDFLEEVWSVLEDVDKESRVRLEEPMRSLLRVLNERGDAQRVEKWRLRAF